MKHCVLASYDLVPSPKGAAQHIISNVSNLKGTYDVSLVTLGDVPLYGYRHYPLDLKIPNWLSRGKEFHDRCMAIFQKNDFDIYHVRSPWEGLAVPPNKTLIYEVNGLASIEMPYHYPKMIEQPQLRMKLRNMELALMERATAIIVTNPITKSYLEDIGTPQNKIHMVPNAPSFPINEKVSSQSTPLQICYIGTLTRWQGVYNAIRALERLENVDFYFSMLCPDKGRKTFEKWLNKREISKKVSVKDTLSKEDLAHFLSTQDIGLAPLTPCERNLIQGCMPIKILDYMSAGLSIVTSDIPVTRYILDKGAYFYRPYSTDSFCQAIEQAIADTHHPYRLQNHNRIRQHFSKEKQKERLLSAYDQINC